MHWTDRRKKFRTHLAGNPCIFPASVYDPVTMRIAEDLGFEAGMLGGSVASLAVLGAPDLITLTLSEFAGLILRMNRAANLPLVVDADALNCLADSEWNGAAGVRVLTPHPGEMARLTGLSIDDVQAQRVDVARDFAVTHHVHVVLKGHRTVIATPEGRVFINLTGNPGMATAGSGDVLTGMIAAWLGQLLDAEAACKLAVYLHGLAGDLAEADEGEVAMTATDIVDRLGDAVLDLSARKKRPTAG